MVRKVLKVDIARALDISDSMVSKHAKRGMPTHSIDLARQWCDLNLVPHLRKGAREPRLTPAAHPSLDLFALLQDAGEDIVARLICECGLDIDKGSVAACCVGDALTAALEARGGPVLDLWAIRLPDPRDAATRARIEALVAQLRADAEMDE